MRITAAQARLNMLNEDESKLKVIMSCIKHDSMFGRRKTEYFDLISDSVKLELKELGYAVKIKNSIFCKRTVVYW